MSSTTQILFHSPALNSLKRDQLVKLCKRHGLKANGKNAELIDRLKQKASELPAEAIEWNDSEEEDGGVPLPGNIFQVPARPSEQWEIVMDNIEEEDEFGSNSNTLTSIRSERTLGSAGEFGTAGSKGSVKSSLKAAIANSFGFKRAAALSKDTTQDAGTSRSLPNLPSQTSISDTPLIDEPAVEPIPGAPSRPGKPAPHNARLSTGTRAGETTTIRLISSEPPPFVLNTPPRLAPFQTTFDLDMGTPSATTKNVWPASPSTKLNSGRLYPTIPPEDLKPSFPSPWKSAAVSSPLKSTPGKTKQTFPSVVPDDVFSPAKSNVSHVKDSSTARKPDSPAQPRGRLSVPHNEPFLFGSPLPRHSMTNNQFGNAAADVLEEMNKRLAAAGVQKVDKTVLENAGKSALPTAPARPLDKASGTDRFAKTHENAFNKMDSIANHYAARRPQPATAIDATKKRKSEALGPRAGPAAKKKSNVAQAQVFGNGGRKKMGIPGGFDMDDDDDDVGPEEDAADRRSSKRIRVSEAEGVHQGRRVSLLPTDNKTDEEKLQEDKKRQREKDALRKKIEARRKSSRGRPSVGGRAMAPSTKPKASRLGFFGAAKSLVRNVWNMGAGNPAVKPAVPVIKPAAPSAPAKPNNNETSSLTRKPVASSSTKATGTTSSSLKVPETSTRHPSARSRSPIPSFNPPEKTSTGTLSGGSVPLNVRKSVTLKAPSSSSLGARPGAAGPSNVSSLGIRRPSANMNTRAGLSSMKSPSPTNVSDATSPALARKRTMSTLLAPTASSLAKRQSAIRPEAGSSKPALTSVGENPTLPATLLQITNGARSPRPLPSRPTNIFSQPLSMPASPTSPPEPKENMSLAGAADTLMAEQDQASTSDSQAVPPKPQTLVVRKPRISRSKVIAKLGEQRSVSDSSRMSSGSSNGGRTRSSMGAAPGRSIGAVKGQRVVSGSSDVMMSAKKKARQSEYARRKSRIAAGSSMGLAPKRQSDVAMNIDD